MAPVDGRLDDEGTSIVRSRYSQVAIVMHWIIAALILINLYLGFRMGFLRGLAQFNVFQLHKSVGITILVLSVARLLWRVLNPPPPGLPHIKPWEKAAAAGVHWGFYVIMVGMPLSGWIVVSTSRLNLPTVLYRLIPWPHFPVVHDLSAGAKAAINDASGATHLILAWSTLALLALHVGAVVKHQFLDRNPVLGRMLPFSRRPNLYKEP
jgi:cytochrome b561